MAEYLYVRNQLRDTLVVHCHFFFLEDVSCLMVVSSPARRISVLAVNRLI